MAIYVQQRGSERRVRVQESRGWEPLHKQKAQKKEFKAPESWVSAMPSSVSGPEIGTRKVKRNPRGRIGLKLKQQDKKTPSVPQRRETSFEGLDGEYRNMLWGFKTYFAEHVKEGKKKAISFFEQTKEKAITRGEPYVELGQRKAKELTSKIPNEFKGTFDAIEIQGVVVTVIGVFGGAVAMPLVLVAAGASATIGFALDVSKASEEEDGFWSLKNLENEKREFVALDGGTWKEKIKQVGENAVTFSSLLKEKGIKSARLYDRKVHQPIVDKTPGSFESTINGLGVGMFCGGVISILTLGYAAPLAMPLCTAVGGLVGLVLDISNAARDIESDRNIWSIKNIVGKLYSIEQIQDPTLGVKVKKYALQAQLRFVKGTLLVERKIVIPIGEGLPNKLRRTKGGIKFGKKVAGVVGPLTFGVLAKPAKVIGTGVGLVLGFVLDVSRASQEDEEGPWVIRSKDMRPREVESVESSDLKGKVKSANRRFRGLALRAKEKGIKGAQVVERKIYEPAKDKSPQGFKMMFEAAGYGETAANVAVSSKNKKGKVAVALGVGIGGLAGLGQDVRKAKKSGGSQKPSDSE